jgi:glycosyltransferase involved in cell wall biosynthesis
MNPDISVLIPVLNSELYLETCLQSIFVQDSNFEIILVDNGSTDNSLKIAARLAAEDSRLKIVHCSQKGIANALNMGLDFCSAQYVARIDSDDCMLPGRLKRQLAVALDDPDIVLVTSQIEYIDTNGMTSGTSNYPVGFLERSYYFSFMNPIAHPAVFFKLSTVLDLGGYNSKYEGAEDLDLWTRLAGTGKIFSQNEVLTQYRIHNQQVSIQSDLYDRELYFRLRNFKRILFLRPNVFMFIIMNVQIFSLFTLKSQNLRRIRRYLRGFFNAR